MRNIPPGIQSIFSDGASPGASVLSAYRLSDFAEAWFTLWIMIVFFADRLCRSISARIKNGHRASSSLEYKGPPPPTKGGVRGDGPGDCGVAAGRRFHRPVGQGKGRASMLLKRLLFSCSNSLSTTWFIATLPSPSGKSHSKESAAFVDTTLPKWQPVVNPPYPEFVLRNSLGSVRLHGPTEVFSGRQSMKTALQRRVVPVIESRRRFRRLGNGGGPGDLQRKDSRAAFH